MIAKKLVQKTPLIKMEEKIISQSYLDLSLFLAQNVVVRIWHRALDTQSQRQTELEGRHTTACSEQGDIRNFYAHRCYTNNLSIAIMYMQILFTFLFCYWCTIIKNAF